MSRTAGRSASRDPRSGDERLGAGASWSRQPELEELPRQRVVPVGSARLGRTGVLAVTVMIGLLAVGFGLFGGRPSTTPAATLGAVATPSAGSSSLVLGPGAGPEVTPWVECGPVTSGPPEVLLEIGGETILGTLESYSGPDGVAAPPSSASDPSPAARVDVPSDAITDLWIVGASCANQWTIELLGDDPSLFNTVGVLDSVTNLGLEPAYAAQNRFPLSLAPYGGNDLTLSATLQSRAFTVRVTWPIHVVPIDRPVGFLHAGNGTGASATEGCDIVMTLGNGWEDRGASCFNAVPEQPIRWLHVAPGEPLEFTLEGWGIVSSEVACGHLDGYEYLPDPDTPCTSEPDGHASISFGAPMEAADWTLAIYACAIQLTEPTNTICGTWYAAVGVANL